MTDFFDFNAGKSEPPPPQPANTAEQGNYGGGYKPQGNTSGGGYKSQGGGNYQKGNGGNGGQKWQPKKKKEFGPIELYKPYAVMGNKEMPPEAVATMARLAPLLDQAGYTARIDGTEGFSDTIEPLIARKEVILAWKGFNSKESKYTYTAEEAFKLAQLFHPAFDSMKDAVKVFLARNVRMIMGQELKNPVMFFICWSDDAVETARDKTSRTGNIGHPIAIASSLRVPVFNLKNPDAEQRIRAFVGI